MKQLIGLSLICNAILGACVLGLLNEISASKRRIDTLQKWVWQQEDNQQNFAFELNQVQREVEEERYRNEDGEIVSKEQLIQELKRKYGSEWLHEFAKATIVLNVKQHECSKCGGEICDECHEFQKRHMDYGRSRELGKNCDWERCEKCGSMRCTSTRVH